MVLCKILKFIKIYLHVIRTCDKYCYRPSSMVGRSVTLVSPAKTAAQIEMLFGLRTRVGPGNHVLDGRPDPPWEGAIFTGKGRPIVKYRDTLRSTVH